MTKGQDQGQEQGEARTFDPNRDLHIEERVVDVEAGAFKREVYYLVFEGTIEVARLDNPEKAARLIDLIKKGYRAEMMHHALSGIQFDLIHCPTTAGSGACPHAYDAIQIVNRTLKALDAGTWGTWSYLPLIRLVLEILAHMYAQHENGDPCYNEPEHLDGYMGNVIRLSEDTENAIIKILDDYLPRDEVEHLRPETWLTRAGELTTTHTDPRRLAVRAHLPKWGRPHE